MIIGMPRMYSLSRGVALSYQLTAGLVFILMCYRGCDEGGKISTNNIMYLYCVETPSDLNNSAHFSGLSIAIYFTVHFSILFISLIILHLRKKSTLHHQASHSTTHSVAMTRRGRGPKRRALDKVTGKVVTEALLGNCRTTKGICDHSSKTVPLPCENTMVSADIVVTDLMIQLSASFHANMKILTICVIALPLPRPFGLFRNSSWL